MKKTYSQGLAFHEINTIFSFTKDICIRHWHLIFFLISSVWWWKVGRWWVQPAASVLIYANVLAVSPSLLFRHHCQCHRREGGKGSLRTLWQVSGLRGPSGSVSGTRGAHIPHSPSAGLGQGWPGPGCMLTKGRELSKNAYSQAPARQIKSGASRVGPRHQYMLKLPSCFYNQQSGET